MKPCLAETLSSVHDLQGNYFLQRKYDGIRCLVRILDGHATPFLRHGTVLPQFTKVVQPLAELKVRGSPLWFDGELVHKQGFGALLGAKARHGEIDCKQLEYVAFDNVFENEWDKNLPKKERSTPPCCIIASSAWQCCCTVTKTSSSQTLK